MKNSGTVQPCFEAYLSIDIPEPLNSMIYALRDEYSDKKMTAMPVDIPVVGHYNNSMELIRYGEKLSDVIKSAISKIHNLGSDDYILHTDCYKVLPNGQVHLLFKENKVISQLKQELARQLSEFNLKMDSDVFSYVIMKTHVSQEMLEKIHNRKIDLAFPIERLTLYHKEAIPLTRIQSWSVGMID